MSRTPGNGVFWGIRVHFSCSTNLGFIGFHVEKGGGLKSGLVLAPSRPLYFNTREHDTLQRAGRSVVSFVAEC